MLFNYFPGLSVGWDSPVGTGSSGSASEDSDDKVDGIYLASISKTSLRFFNSLFSSCFERYGISPLSRVI